MELHGGQCIGAVPQETFVPAVMLLPLLAKALEQVPRVQLIKLDVHGSEWPCLR